MGNNNVLDFEAFKHSKSWDDEYPKYIGHQEKYFGTSIIPETLYKRLYYAIRYLEGVSNNFWIMAQLGLNMNPIELKKGKQIMIEMLEGIIERLKTN